MKYKCMFSTDTCFEVYVEADNANQAQSLAEDKLNECLGDAEENFLRSDVSISEDNFTYDGVEEIEDDEYQSYEVA